MLVEKNPRRVCARKVLPHYGASTSWRDQTALLRWYEHSRSRNSLLFSFASRSSYIENAVRWTAQSVALPAKSINSPQTSFVSQSRRDSEIGLQAYEFHLISSPGLAARGVTTQCHLVLLGQTLSCPFFLFGQRQLVEIPHFSPSACGKAKQSTDWTNTSLSEIPNEHKGFFCPFVVYPCMQHHICLYTVENMHRLNPHSRLITATRTQGLLPKRKSRRSSVKETEPLGACRIVPVRSNSAKSPMAILVRWAIKRKAKNHKKTE